MLKKIVTCIFLFILLLVIHACSDRKQKNDTGKEEWVSIFNGHDFTGWDIKIKSHPLNENYKKTFRIEDSMLRVSYNDYEKFNNQFGHIFTQTSYSYYKLKLQYRFVGDHVADAPDHCIENSGIMLHSQSAKSMELDQYFPVSLEFLLLSGNREDAIPTGSVCTLGTFIIYNGKPNTEHIMKSNSKTYFKNEWVSGMAEVYGDSLICHIINDDTVLVYRNPKIGDGFVAGMSTWTFAQIKDSTVWLDRANTPLKEGHIALQAESQPIDFRKMELLNLVGCTDRKAKNYKDYFIKSDNSQCKY